jgi:hypothetical protein
MIGIRCIIPDVMVQSARDRQANVERKKLFPPTTTRLPIGRLASLVRCMDTSRGACQKTSHYSPDAPSRRYSRKTSATPTKHKRIWTPCLVKSIVLWFSAALTGYRPDTTRCTHLVCRWRNAEQCNSSPLPRAKRTTAETIRLPRRGKPKRRKNFCTRCH